MIIWAEQYYLEKLLLPKSFDEKERSIDCGWKTLLARMKLFVGKQKVIEPKILMMSLAAVILVIYFMSCYHSYYLI